MDRSHRGVPCGVRLIWWAMSPPYSPASANLKGLTVVGATLVVALLPQRCAHWATTRVAPTSFIAFRDLPTPSDWLTQATTASFLKLLFSSFAPAGRSCVVLRWQAHDRPTRRVHRDRRRAA